MIIQEFYKTRNDGKILYKIYSDKGNYILQVETNIEYEVAIDVENAPYTYVETEKKIEKNVVGIDYVPDYEERENLEVKEG